MRIIRLRRIDFLIALAVIVLLFALAEATSLFFLHQIADDNQFRTYASLRQLQNRALSEGGRFERYDPHRFVGYIPRANYQSAKNRHNSLGYRGAEFVMPKPPDEFRIVCIGGSTTYTASVADYRLSYPALLESGLRDQRYNVRVVNAGGEGWTSHASLANLQFRVLDLEPDMVIIDHAINDLIARLVWPPEAYRGDNSGGKLPHVSSIFMPSIFEHSTYLRILMVNSGHTMPHTSLRRTLSS